MLLPWLIDGGSDRLVIIRRSHGIMGSQSVYGVDIEGQTLFAVCIFWLYIFLSDSPWM